MNNLTELANYALSQIGEGFQITDIDEDKSEEAKALRSTYSGLIQEKLREYRWERFVKKASLGLVETNPNLDWSFSYRYPSNCLDFHRIVNGDRSGLNVTPVPFELSSDDQGLLIFSDWTASTGVVGEWTLANPPFTLWASDFKTAFAFEWAAIIGPRILKGSSMSLIARLEAKAAAKWLRAKANSHREARTDPKPVSRIQRARGSGVKSSRRFNNAPDDNA